MADQPAVETVTFTIESPDGDTDDVTVPAPVLDLLSEEDVTRTEVVGDMALLSLVQQVHAVVHHGEEEVGPELRDAEEAASELFEERFGVSYAEATGHSH